QLSERDLPTLGKNLFVELMKEITTELNLTHCWGCGRMQMTEQCPWKGEGLGPEQLLQWNQTEILRGVSRPEGWVLSHEVIGEVCITHQG
ncbi:ENR1 protein, partial [Leucopsar rothschildi]|nr:ENR1 protein [Leucopsar rothschildi]